MGTTGGAGEGTNGGELSMMTLGILETIEALMSGFASLKTQVEVLRAAPPPLVELVSDKTVAARWDLELKLVRPYCKRGVFPGARSFGKAGWRIPAESLHAFLGNGGAPEPDSEDFDVKRLGTWRDAA